MHFIKLDQDARNTIKTDEIRNRRSSQLAKQIRAKTEGKEAKQITRQYLSFSHPLVHSFQHPTNPTPRASGPTRRVVGPEIRIRDMLPDHLPILVFEPLVLALEHLVLRGTALPAQLDVHVPNAGDELSQDRARALRGDFERRPCAIAQAAWESIATSRLEEVGEKTFGSGLAFPTDGFVNEVVDLLVQVHEALQDGLVAHIGLDYAFGCGFDFGDGCVEVFDVCLGVFRAALKVVHALENVVALLEGASGAVNDVL